MNWSKMTVADLGHEIGKGGVDPVDLVDYFLDRIGSAGGQIYARTTPTRARAEAEAAAVRAVQRRAGCGHVLSRVT